MSAQIGLGTLDLPSIAQVRGGEKRMLKGVRFFVPISDAQFASVESSWMKRDFVGCFGQRSSFRQQ